MHDDCVRRPAQRGEGPRPDAVPARQLVRGDHDADAAGAEAPRDAEVERRHEGPLQMDDVGPARAHGALPAHQLDRVRDTLRELSWRRPAGERAARVDRTEERVCDLVPAERAYVLEEEPGRVEADGVAAARQLVAEVPVVVGRVAPGVELDDAHGGRA